MLELLEDRDIERRKNLSVKKKLKKKRKIIREKCKRKWMIKKID